MNTYQQPVDNLDQTRRNHVQLIHIFASYLTEAVRCHRVRRAGVPDSSQARMQLMGKLCLLIGLLSQMTIINANAVESKDVTYFKLYAHSRILDSKEYRCLDLLWNRESNWNPLAHNKSGGAYGIPQLKNKRIQHLDGFSQIDFGIKYIKHRHSTACNAWKYWLKHRNY